MATLDVFNDDAFGVINLTSAINEVTEGQKVPGIIDDLFEEEGINTTAVFIEKEGDTFSLVPAGERGSPGDTTVKDKRTAISFQTQHLPLLGGINADEIQGVRQFGSETELQTVESMVNKRLAKMRRRIEATIAFHRIGAVKGDILDSDGTTSLLNLFTAFGVSQNTLGMALTTGTTDVRGKAVSAKRLSEDHIGDSAMITGWRAICGRGFFDALVSHAKVEDAYKYWSTNSQMRDDLRVGFRYADINWMEYYGNVGGVNFIGTDDAYLIPEGVEDLFITRYAPADYMEVVNTIGIPFYAKQELRKFGKGVDLEAQSNPLNICTRPRSVIKLTKV